IAAMSVQGRTRYASLIDALVITWNQGWATVAVMCGLTAFVLPLLEILLLIWLLGPLARGRLAPGHGALARLLGLLRPWCMVPVFVLAIVVAVVKLAGMAAVSPGAGLVGFGLLTVLMTMLGRVSPPMLWRMAEAA